MERAAEDYANSLRALWPHADFFVINVSSPNTPNLRELQDKAALDEVLAAVQEVNRQGSVVSGHSSMGAATEGGGPNTERSRSTLRTPLCLKPVLVKVAPDLSFEALDEILELTGSRQIAGIVATNTTVARPDASDPELKRVYAESGGLSGRPLRARSTDIIRHVYCQTKGSLPIIGVGGIFSADDAWEKITAGASLVQLYTGMIYEGPALAREIVTGLKRRLTERGFGSLKDAVGKV